MTLYWADRWRFYDTYCNGSGRPLGVDIVYQAIGRMTRRLASLKVGERLDIWGPLGNGFPPAKTGHLIMAAGGIGQTPFMALARHYLGLGDYGQPPMVVPRAKKVTLCYGVRTAAFWRAWRTFAVWAWRSRSVPTMALPGTAARWSS